MANYVQATAPASPAWKDTWVDTSTTPAVYKVYTAGATWEVDVLPGVWVQFQGGAPIARGATHTDVTQMTAPASPTTGTRRVFVDESDGKLKVRTSAGSNISLEEQGSGGTHATAHEPAGGDAMAVDAAAGTGSLRTLGTNSTAAAAGNHVHAGGISLLKTTADQTINAGAAVFVDVTGLTFACASGVDYAFTFYVTFQSAAATTGWKCGLKHPGGTLDFWASSPTIANGAAGVATHTERHNTAVDDMTLLTSTVTAGVDLAIRIDGRYKCTANGTFAVRFANELANTNLVVQKGSWGFYF